MPVSPVIFNNTVLRDGHQSLAATRMRTEQMVPACTDLDALGFGALETWGGATIDAGLRFLDEFPFDRLDALKKAAPRTPHMMLLRGQNIVQYSHFADDVVEAFISCAAHHGIAIFRIFDALNDIRNLETAIRAVKKAGKHAQGTLCYTSSPVHAIPLFIEQGRQLADLGCDSIVIKDMAGLIPPPIVHAIIKGLKQDLSLPVWMHTHETAGLGAAAYYAAIDAGVDAVDCSIVPFANGTGQPDTARMLALLEKHPRRPEYDQDILAQLKDYFQGVYSALKDYTSRANEVIDNDALAYQVPGGMLSNFRTQLREQGMAARFGEVMQEIPRVRQALGWIPLVTPTSQIVGVQAMLNVKFGPWQNISPQAADIALGYYGRTPAPVDPLVQKAAARQAGKKLIDCRPADLQKPAMPDLRKALQERHLPADDEHCVIYAMFPQELVALYKNSSEQQSEVFPEPEELKREQLDLNTRKTDPSGPPIRQLAVTIDGQRHNVTVELLGEQDTDNSVQSSLAALPSAAIPEQSDKPVHDKGAGKPVGGKVLQAPLAGKIVSIAVDVGEAVRSGDTLLTLEAMKMNTYVTAPTDSCVQAIAVAPGDTVQEGQMLMRLG